MKSLILSHFCSACLLKLRTKTLRSEQAGWKAVWGSPLCRGKYFGLDHIIFLIQDAETENHNFKITWTKLEPHLLPEVDPKQSEATQTGGKHIYYLWTGLTRETDFGSQQGSVGKTPFPMPCLWSLSHTPNPKECEVPTNRRKKSTT